MKSGFRWFLIPPGQSGFAAPEHQKIFEERRAEGWNNGAADKLAAAEARKGADRRSAALPLATRPVKKGLLSVSTNDIANACCRRRRDRQVGCVCRKVHSGSPVKYQIELHLHTDVDATLTVKVVAED